MRFLSYHNQAAEPVADSPAAEPVAEPALGSTVQPRAPIDLTKFASEKYNLGKEKGAKEMREVIRQTFGTDSIEELQKIAAERKKPAPDTNAQLQEILDQNRKLRETLEEKEKREEGLRLKAEVSAHVAGLKFINPVGHDAMMNEFLNSYFIQDGVVYKKGEIPVPELNADQTRAATVKDIFLKLNKDPRFAGMILSESKIGLPEGGPGPQAGASVRMPTREERLSYQFQQAVKASGQAALFLNNRPIDMSLVRKHL